MKYALIKVVRCTDNDDHANIGEYGWIPPLTSRNRLTEDINLAYQIAAKYNINGVNDGCDCRVEVREVVE